MSEDKMTAMWEEDGDLMRLKKFFGYVCQGDGIKERIKDKTVEKILESVKNQPLENVMFVAAEASTEINNETNKEASTEKSTQVQQAASKANRFGTLAARIRNKLLYGNKKAFVLIGCAAVIVLAVGLGVSGTLTGVDLQKQVSSLQTATDSTRNDRANGFAASPDAGVIDESTEGGAADAGFTGSPSSTEPAAAQKKSLENSVPSGYAEYDFARQKTIYMLDISLKADDVKVASKALEEKVKTLGGYVAESTRSNYDNGLTAFLSLRIPAEQFETFKNSIPQFGTVVNEHQNTEDVSMTYFDTETRLRSWEAQEKRYLEILEKANSVEDILKIENSLAAVRQEIESLKGQLKYYDNRVEYSQVTINIEQARNDLTVNNPWQPISLKNTLIAVKNALIKTVSFLWNALNYVLVFIGYALPVLAVLLLIWLVCRIIRKRRMLSEKSFRRNKEDEE
ncbi:MULTISPECIES: DUF4349 domain-containing protein [unclassified Dehalobacter]|uniref:DUF4349 domain-containing protein n=1 Tax=unclassified Dehalobacter TaxID=2635733 RepID=UPI000E6CB60F|nr:MULTISPECIES: DUF4349 domain-containing protein [unclassified Dehalobacter]RJE48457.1 hypothetical protein A7K50_11305 [Dehalobacter sp. MCB1]TCX50526.1 DUF4349 domain-containing protein [Dehalobacter sp. 14DCB1]TCX52234.1 DUF4349 domain-containing protein [Dehalobacter sp. 12DCB1]